MIARVSEPGQLKLDFQSQTIRLRLRAVGLSGCAGSNLYAKVPSLAYLIFTENPHKIVTKNEKNRSD